AGGGARRHADDPRHDQRRALLPEGGRAMRLEDLRPAAGSTRPRRRIGRGPASGTGKTSGKGHKGLRARSGGGSRVGFEGGQMPLYRRLPKRGFLPHGSKREFALVKVKDLSGGFRGGSVVDPEAVVEAGWTRRSSRGAVKVLGDGDIQHSLTVKIHRISESARRKLEAAGGQVEVLPS